MASHALDIKTAVIYTLSQGFKAISHSSHSIDTTINSRIYHEPRRMMSRVQARGNLTCTVHSRVTSDHTDTCTCFVRSDRCRRFGMDYSCIHQHLKTIQRTQLNCFGFVSSSKWFPNYHFPGRCVTWGCDLWLYGVLIGSLTFFISFHIGLLIHSRR